MIKSVLIEPYRSALILQAVDEGLMRPVPPDGPGIIRLRKVITKDIIDDALRLAVLSDVLAMVWVDPRQIPQERRADHILSSGLENTGIIQFIELPENKVGCGKGISDIRDVWKREKDLVQIYERFILTQLHAKGIPFHWSLLRLLTAVRTEDNTAIQLVEPCVPQKDKPFARAVVKGASDPRVDLVVVNAVHELKLALDYAVSSGGKLAGAAPDDVDYSETMCDTDAALQVWRICIDVLLGESIEFPAPTSLMEVLKLRECSELREFRSLLIPFITSIAEGSEDAIHTLRKKLIVAAKAFKRFPTVRKFGAYSTYCSIALGIVEGVLGMFGPSIGLGIISLGAEKLARSWEKQGRWLYMTKQGVKS